MVKLLPCGLMVTAALVLRSYLDVSMYQLTTAIHGVRDLLSVPKEDIEKCARAYEFFRNGTANSVTEEETEHVRAMYTVLHRLMAIGDIEKMYIPPQIDAKKGLFGNQLLWEQHVATTLHADSSSRLLDMGCGRGRIAHHMSKITGAKVSGYNIDETQVQQANDYATETGLDDRLDFKVGDHHKRLPYEDNSFNGAYSFEAVWPFLKQRELAGTAAEMFRVMKPGARYSCGEYLWTPHFDQNNSHHMHLHKNYMSTLAATQSNYPQDVTDALESAGFKLILSAPSVAPAWPVCDSKTDLYLVVRRIVSSLAKVGLIGDWALGLLDDLLYGGQAWNEAEKMKIADLNWQIIVEKPLK